LSRPFVGEYTSRNGSELSPWLVRTTPRQSTAIRLFCFPYAGVGAVVFRTWAAGLPADVDVCAVQLPGRTTRMSEAPIASIPVLVDGIVSAVTPHLDTPFVFFGHSMGAVLAAEVTLELARRSLPLPRYLMVSARRPPHIADPESPLRNLPDAEFVEEIVRRYGGIPPEILREKDFLALLLPALRADIAALETHQPPRPEPLACPVVVLGGSEDALTPMTHLEAWREVTNSKCEIYVFPGGHFYLESARSAVLKKVSEFVTRAADEARERAI